MSRARHKPAPDAPTEAASTDDGLYWEAKVADALGLSRDRLRAIRTEHMREDAGHFRLVRNEVVLTEAGLALLNEIIAAQAEITPPADTHSTPKFQVPSGPPQRAVFKVHRTLPNKRLVQCMPAGPTARPVLVHVKDNTNFMAGMSLEAIEAEHGTWQYRGRLPRRRGKW